MIFRGCLEFSRHLLVVSHGFKLRIGDLFCPSRLVRSEARSARQHQERCSKNAG